MLFKIFKNKYELALFGAVCTGYWFYSVLDGWGPYLFGTHTIIVKGVILLPAMIGMFIAFIYLIYEKYKSKTTN